MEENETEIHKYHRHRITDELNREMESHALCAPLSSAS